MKITQERRYELSSYRFGWHGLINATSYRSETYAMEATIAVWREAIDRFSTWKFAGENGPIHIEFDFSTVVEQFERKLDYDVRVTGAFSGERRNIADFIAHMDEAKRRGLADRDSGLARWDTRKFDDLHWHQLKATIAAVARGNSEDSRSPDPTGGKEVLAALSHMFVAMNLAVPGSCCLVGDLELVDESSKWSAPMSLTSFDLEDCLTYGLFSRVPEHDPISVVGIDRCYRSIGVSGVQEPTTGTQRALVALLHIAELGGPGATPEKTLWIAHVIESLYDPSLGGTIPTI